MRVCVRALTPAYDTVCVAILSAPSGVCAYGGRVCVRRLTIPHAWPTCVRSLSCVRAACVRAYDAAYVAVLHVHSRMCVNVLRAYVDVVIRVLAVSSIFHASFSRLFACSGPGNPSPTQT